MRRSVLALSVALALAACSSGPPPLTKAEWISKANAICASYNQRFSDIATSADYGTRGGAVKGFDQVLQLAASAEKELKALTPPRADKATVNGIFAAFDAVLLSLQKLRDGVASGDPSEAIDLNALPEDLKALSDQTDAAGTTSNQLFDAYGASECGSRGSGE